MNILSPLTVTDAMVAAGTSIAEPAAGETAWVSAGTYIVGDLRIRATTHQVYECALGHTGITALPENDPTRWLNKSPTQRWAPFDIYVSTAAKTVTSMTYVLLPGYFNAVALYGLTGSNITVSIKDAPAGATIFSHTSSLSEDPPGWYEFLFSPLKLMTKLILKNLPIRPNAELTIAVTTGAGNPVAIGMINVGDYRALAGDGEWGGTQFGASAEPISYSYTTVNPDGTTAIVRRTSATGMRATVMLPRDQADRALALIQEVLDVPVSWVASDIPGYAGLNVFGLGSASVNYDGYNHASLNLNVKGLI
jgi:hypothetical protein